MNQGSITHFFTKLIVMWFVDLFKLKYSRLASRLKIDLKNRS